MKRKSKIILLGSMTTLPAILAVISCSGSTPANQKQQIKKNGNKETATDKKPGKNVDKVPLISLVPSKPITPVKPIDKILLISLTNSKPLDDKNILINKIKVLFDKSIPNESEDIRRYLFDLPTNKIKSWDQSKKYMLELLIDIINKNKDAVAISSDNKKIGIDLQYFAAAAAQKSMGVYQLETNIYPFNNDSSKWYAKARVQFLAKIDNLDDVKREYSFVKESEFKYMKTFINTLIYDRDISATLWLNNIGLTIWDKEIKTEDKYLAETDERYPAQKITHITNKYWDEDSKAWKNLTETNRAIVELDFHSEISNQALKLISKVRLIWNKNIFTLAKNNFYPKQTWKSVTFYGNKVIHHYKKSIDWINYLRKKLNIENEQMPELKTEVQKSRYWRELVKRYVNYLRESHIAVLEKEKENKKPTNE